MRVRRVTPAVQLLMMKKYAGPNALVADIHFHKIIVAQRISTVMRAEQILVLDEGVLVGKGTHTELMQSCEVYRQIATSQLSKEELEHAK